jgi:hypothetical protein
MPLSPNPVKNHETVMAYRIAGSRARSLEIGIVGQFDFGADMQDKSNFFCA